MVISPNDFSLWARLTGNKYPSTPKERAQKGPEVQNFIQNLGKEGMLEGKDTEEPKKENNLGKNIAKGALIAGGIAALGAASRDKRVQDIAQRAASTTKTKIDDFLSNLGGPRVIDRDIVDASYDVTPDPVQQQSNVASTQKSLPEGPSLIQRIEQKKAEMVDSFKPAVTGETFQTSGAISEDNIYGDIGDAKLRARRTFGPTIDALKEIDPGRKDLGRMGNKMLTQAQQDRDFDIAYIIGRNKGLDDTNAVRLARQTAGFDGSATVRKPTEYRELLGTLKTESPIKPRVDDLLNLVKTGPQINLPESVQEPGALVQLAAGSTPSNKVPTMGATIGGSSLTDKHATKMAVDNVLDEARERITKLPRSGPAEPTRQLNLFKAEGDIIGPGETQQEFINRQFSKSAAEAGDTTPEVSGTTIDASRFPGGTMKQRIADLKTANFQALLSGNTTAAMQQAINATGRKVSNGLEYKNNPRLAIRDADIISAAQLSGKDFQGNEIYFGPLETKLKQNLKLGTQFPEILQDPTRENVIFQGELRDRTDFEKPVATTASQQRYDDKVQKQLDYREEKIGEAEAQFERRMSAIQDMEGKLKEGQQNVKNIIAGLPERTDLTNRQKQQTAERLGETSRLIRGRLDQQLKAISDAKSDFQSRAKGIMETTQEKIDNIPVEKTIKSQQGELYELRETQNPDTGEVTQNIVPLFTRTVDSKQEFDTGVGLEKQEIETGSSRGSQLQDTGSRTKLLSISDLKGRGPGAEAIRQTLMAEAERKGIDLTDTTPDDQGETNLMKFMKNKEIVSNPIPTGERMVGTPTGIAGDIAKIYRTGDPATVNQRVNEFKERLKRQQATKLAGGLTIEDIQDL